MESNSEDPHERRFTEKGVLAKYAGSMGWGLFAGTDFAPGEILFEVDYEHPSRGIVVPWQQAFGDCDERSATLIPDLSFCCSIEHPFWFTNHSCEPNSGFINWGRPENGRLQFAAYRHIVQGEHITTDYAPITTPHDGSPDGAPWSMRCLCGSHDCRRLVEGFDVLPLAKQLEFVLPATPPFGRVVAHIAAPNKHLMDRLSQSSTAHYRQLQDALREQVEFAAYLRRVLGVPG